MSSAGNLRVATYNIHKGVQGLGPARRLEIHNLGHAIEQLDADIVCLQEVRKHNRQAAARFARWPELPQADFLAPEGYTAVYETNAITKHGEHGNALLTRWPVLHKSHRDISDHRFEQRGLLHTVIDVDGAHVGPPAAGDRLFAIDLIAKEPACAGIPAPWGRACIHC